MSKRNAIKNAYLELQGYRECPQCKVYSTGPCCRTCQRPFATHPGVDPLPPRPEPVAQRSECKALELPPEAADILAGLTGSLVVRITRVGGRRVDDDNLSGGCKELRDAIAEALGRDGDDERDGLRWIYEQVPGNHAGFIGMKIEVWEDESKTCTHSETNP